MRNVYYVERLVDSVIVAIMFNRADHRYHFVNLTMDHICTCGFDTVEDALLDLEKCKKDGSVVCYRKL